MSSKKRKLKDIICNDSCCINSKPKSIKSIINGNMDIVMKVEDIENMLELAKQDISSDRIITGILNMHSCIKCREYKDEKKSSLVPSVKTSIVWIVRNFLDYIIYVRSAL